MPSSFAPSVSRNGPWNACRTSWTRNSRGPPLAAISACDTCSSADTILIRAPLHMNRVCMNAHPLRLSSATTVTGKLRAGGPYTSTMTGYAVLMTRSIVVRSSADQPGP